MAEHSSMSGGAAGGSIDSVVNSVKEALTNLDPHAGASAISMVQGALKAVPGTSALSDALSSLREQLSSGSPDGARLRQSLMQVSDQTRAVAGQAGPLSTTLTQLADRLATVGSQVGGGGSMGTSGGSSV
ncbi:MAG: hypothetical protein M3154_05725 [Candidatus Eremiobacteraeota bacterium]|nr:hypothetical protein [Candidatus Eremiobacteraeota bacterium]